MALPDAKGRERILEQYISKFAIAKKIGVKKLATDTTGFTGAWLRELVLTAFSISLKNKRKTLTQACLDGALDKIKKLREKTNQRRRLTKENGDIFG